MADEIRVDTGMGTITRTPLLRRTAWGAIFAGTFVALACQLLLTALGIAIGAATINPAREAGNPAEGLGIFTGIWWLITALMSLFAGGLTCAWLAGFPRIMDGVIHGLVVWGLTAALSAWLLTTSAATLIGGAMGTLQTAAMSPAAGPAYRDVAGAENLDRRLEQWAEDARRALTRTDPSSSPIGVDQETQSILDQYLSGRAPVTEADRLAAVNALADRKDMEREKARQVVNDYLAHQSGTMPSGQGGRLFATPERHRAERAAQATANAVTNAAVWTFFAMLLGLGAAAAGGAVGRPQYLLDERRTLVP
jgi:hypothetical protein